MRTQELLQKTPQGLHQKCAAAPVPSRQGHFFSAPCRALRRSDSTTFRAHPLTTDRSWLSMWPPILLPAAINQQLHYMLCQSIQGALAFEPGWPRHLNTYLTACDSSGIETLEADGGRNLASSCGPARQVPMSQAADWLTHAEAMQATTC